MKNVLFIAALMLLGVTGCNKSEEKDASTEKLCVEDFNVLGELHNSMLQNIKDNFKYNDSLVHLTKNEKIEYLLKYNNDFIDMADIDMNGKGEIKSRMSFYRNMLDASTFSPFKSAELVTRVSDDAHDSLNEGFSNDSILSVEDINNLIENLYYAHNLGMIPENAFNVISEIIVLLQKSNEGLITDALLEEKITETIDNVNNMDLKDRDISLAYIAPILVIAKYSLEWWKNNPDAMSSDEGKIAPFVYADAAGAIEGVVGYALTTSSSEITWSGAGWSALAGGALSSIGFGVGVIKYLRRFF